MKNFKLLLATTAILSTAMAMGANAESISLGKNVTITPSVQIITPLNVTPEQELKFGTLISPKVGDTVIIGINGEEEATGKATLLNKTIADSSDLQRGIIRFSDIITPLVEQGTTTNFSFSFPNGLILKYSGDIECGTVDFVLNETPVNSSTGSGYATVNHSDYYYGGTFTVTRNALPAGECSAEGVVTVIATGTAIEMPEPGGTND